MEKQELEELLGYSVTDNLFKGALGYTRNKQEYAYQLEKRPAVLQHWYLMRPAEHCVIWKKSTRSGTRAPIWIAIL